jgi:DNA-binding NarL/FixJ family response regulator
MVALREVASCHTVETLSGRNFLTICGGRAASQDRETVLAISTISSDYVSPSAVARKTVFVVDDHPVVRDGYARMITNQPDLELAGETGDAAAVMDMVEKSRPDLVLLDLSLKCGNGLELCKAINSQYPDVKVLVVSMHDETLYAERVLRAGGDGYINKAEATRRLIDAIREVLSGKYYLSSRMRERMLTRAIGVDGFEDHSPIDRLSDRELEVFEMIGSGMTTREIAAQLTLSPKTIESYRENLKAKLNLTNSTELTRHAVHWVLERSSM